MAAQSTVLYANKPDGQFDLDYYLNTHMPLVAKHWGPLGLQKWEVVKFASGLGGAAPEYIIQALLYWDSAESVKTATTSEAAKIVFGDVPNFTNVTPVFTAGSVVGEASV